MTELVRAHSGVVGVLEEKRTATAWNRDAGLGFVVPLLLVGGAAGITSNPIVATGLNSYMLMLDNAVGVAGQVVVTVNAVRPDLTSWPAMPGQLMLSTAAAGILAAPIQGMLMGSKGRDQTSDFQGWCSLLFTFTLTRPGGFGNATLNRILLQSMTRP